MVDSSGIWNEIFLKHLKAEIPWPDWARISPKGYRTYLGRCCKSKSVHDYQRWGRAQKPKQPLYSFYACPQKLRLPSNVQFI